MRWAHRGWHDGVAPLENTWPAFERAIEAGAAGIELDVQRSADGVAVVVHDAALTRLTGGRETARVDALPWSVLRSIRLEGGAGMLPLAEVLGRIRGSGVTVNVELKTLAVTPAALAAITGDDAVVLSSFVVEALACAQRLRPNLPRALLTERAEVEAPLAQLAALQCVAWHANAEALSAASVQTAGQAGYGVRAYTVNDPVVAERLAGWGVEGIFTDLLDRV
jgi:glycerophosphoryl diester phosphodiesterase